MSTAAAGVPMPFDHEIPFLRFIGAELIDWGPEHAVIQMPITARHLNRSDVVHGGVYSVLIDAAGGLSGCFGSDGLHHRRAYTLSLTTSFLGTARDGALTARGSLRRRGRRVYFATGEVRNGANEVVALGEGSFLYRGMALDGAAAAE
jgi:uncharacterized protein (TIGR00369 family)